MVKLPLSMEHALLGLLAERPMHAYEMHQTLAQGRALGLVWRLKQSQLYALLGRLEEAGYLRGRTEAQGTRPPRRVLHLTQSGQAAFFQWMAAPVEHGRDFRQEFLAKLFFAAKDGPETVAALVEAQRAACREWLHDLEAQSTALAPERPYERLVLEFRSTQIEAILQWLDTCAATLAEPVSS